MGTAKTRIIVNVERVHLLMNMQFAKYIGFFLVFLLCNTAIGSSGANYSDNHQRHHVIPALITQLLTAETAQLASITVTPSDPSVVQGLTQQFTATASYSDGSLAEVTDNVVWFSSKNDVAFIENAIGSEGLATALKIGTSEISATHVLSGVSGGTTLTVTPALLISISVTPTNPTIASGLSQQFMATGFYTDGTTLDITSGVTWASSKTNVAFIDNAPGFKGLATGLSIGITEISATHLSSGISASTDLAVDVAELVSIVVTPTNPSIIQGLTQQFLATGHYTDGSSVDMTNGVAWVSSDMTVAIVDNSVGFKGIATGLNAGITEISATHLSSGVSGKTELTVTVP